MAKPIYLVVIADDFGMSPSMNEGIIDTYQQGILTTTTLMAPCPAFGHAVALAHQTAIPVGVHLTLNAEWDGYRWGSLTGLPSLNADDNRLPKTKIEAQKKMVPAEMLAEMRAQVLAVYKAGLKPTHLDSHMGTIYPYTDELAAMVREFRLPFRFKIKDRPELSVQFDTPIEGGEGLSSHAPEKKGPWLLKFLESLKPGFHMLCGHPSRPGSEMHTLVGPEEDAERRNWAVYYRLTDRDQMMNPHAAEIIRKRGIKRINFTEMIRLQRWKAPGK
ncbi:MAG TPA: ChbG/HpnK family deacetylase [Planctomycetota bacterium]|nr:ChbG/HpnK family deacetylase [Planctomycetota bacterium]